MLSVARENHRHPYEVPKHSQQEEKPGEDETRRTGFVKEPPGFLGV